MRVPRLRVAGPLALALAGTTLAGAPAGGHAQPAPDAIKHGAPQLSGARQHHPRLRRRRRPARSRAHTPTGARPARSRRRAAPAGTGSPPTNASQLSSPATQPILPASTPSAASVLYLPAPGPGQSAAGPSAPAPGAPAAGPPTEPTPEPQPPAPPTPPTPQQPPTEPPPAAQQDPFAGQRLYADPNSAAAQTQRQWTAEGQTTAATQIAKVASEPVAQWFGDWTYGHGGTAGDVNWWVSTATAAGALPVLVAYDIPWRDCSQYSSGGASGATAYEQFIDALVQGIDGRRAVVIVEPDALAELECLPSNEQASYYELLEYAVTHLGANPLVSVYLDAGNAGWQSASTMASRLRKADVSGARGFSLNISNFDTTTAEASYGAAIAAQLGDGAHFVIDTSRNGRGPAPGGAWCNPPGRGLGQAPTSQTGDPLIDAYLWVKQPGLSDGTCEGGPAAGQWWPAYALELAENATG